MPTLKSPHAINYLNGFIRQADPTQKEAFADNYYDSEALTEEFKGELDADSTESLTGMRADRVSPSLMLQSTKRILGISRGAEKEDDRDSLEYQSMHDASDYLSDKIKKDQQGIMRQALWKITQNNGNLDKVSSGIMDKHVDHLFNKAGVSQVLSAINPLDAHDQNQRVTRMGEGAMSSIDVIPDEARAVQSSYMNFVDPVRSVESMKIGVDLRLARNVRKGKDNQMYTEFINARTGEKEWVDARTAAKANITTSEYKDAKTRYVPSITRNGTETVKKADVDYYVPTGDDLFSAVASTVPLKSSVKGMRLLMGSKFATGAMPLVNREAPHVRSAGLYGDGNSLERDLGKAMGVIRADSEGEVMKVSPQGIKVKYADGEVREHELYDSMPTNEKTYMRNIAKVKKGDKIAKGDVLAARNFTNDKGVMALGSNLRTAYWGYDQLTFEDNIIISEEGAKKMTSEHMYKEDFENDKDTETGLKKFKAVFPGRYSPDQMANLDDLGVAKKGTVLQYGDPMVLAVTTKKGSDTLGRAIRSDASKTWKHTFPGVITDVNKGRKGYNLAVRANVPMETGDKLSIRQGGKGVVTVMDQDKMPRDAEGRPLEVIMSPYGIISRTNSAQLVEAMLGKVSAKTGKSYNLEGFSNDKDMVEFAEQELAKHGLTDTEEVMDVRSGKKVPGIFTGNMYYYKQKHTSDSKGKAVSSGGTGYTEDEQPSKGASGKAKHFGVMEQQALLGAGATEVLKDMKLIKGQKNDSFWRQMMLGQTPTAPKTPAVYEKFKNMLKAAGINFHEGKESDNIMAMTNEGANKLTEDRVITNTSTYTQKDFKPMKGGLFDTRATGSDKDGKRWSYIDLPEPILNPIMADPIRHILGKTNKELNVLMRTGRLKDELSKVNMNQVKSAALDDIRNGSKGKRDLAVKAFRAVSALQKQGTSPMDYLMDRVPVLPPKYRPITQSHGMNMVNDANYMYSAMMNSVDDFKETEGLTGEIREEARELMYKNYAALAGLTDPVQEELQQKQIGGILKNIVGKSSPKKGMIQRRLLGTSVDTSGLAVINVNPALKLNQVGLPENKAYELYEKFVIRDLVQSGMPAMQAAKAVKAQSKPARESLERVVASRPVIVNRAPTLHKYSMIALYPKLLKGDSMQIAPALVAPLGADFDGDTMSYTVPVSAAAVKEAKEKMMPDSYLISDADDTANFVPQIESLVGLHYASKERMKGKKTVTFNTMAEAKLAYKKGLIRIDDPIKIKDTEISK